jgi:hypothetical protein
MAKQGRDNVNPIELQKSLKGVDYPANKQALQDKAKSNGADEVVMDFLEQIPDQDYDTPAQVTKQISGDQPSTQKNNS